MAFYRAAFALVLAAAASAALYPTVAQEADDSHQEYLEPDDEVQEPEDDDRASDAEGRDDSHAQQEDEDGAQTTARARPCSSKIVGGCASRPGSWPSFVQLGSRGYSGCGGTLIAKNWVLTAAHCVAEVQPGPSGCVRSVKSADSLEIYEGSNRPVGTAGVKPKRTLRVAEVIAHEGYTGDCGASPMQNDIALLRLRDAAKATPGILASERSLASLAQPGKLTTVIGVGITQQGTDSRPQAMMQVDVPLVSEATCRKGASNQYNASSINYTNQLCAGYPEGGKDSCQGDSGGPLFARDGLSQPVQVGVVSWGIGCAQARNWGVYSSVGKLQAWIRRHVSEAQFAEDSDGGGGLDSGLQQVVSDHDGLAPSQIGNVSIKILPGPQVKIGEALQVEITSSIAGKLIVLNQDETGKTTQLFPNNFSASTSAGQAKERIAAGVPVLIPAPGDTFALRATPPAGRNSIVAIIAPVDAKLSDVTAPGKTLKPLADVESLLREVAERSNEADHTRGVEVEGTAASTRAVGRASFEIIN